MSAGTDIKTWQNRAYAELGPGYFRFKPDSYMEAEITELRAALEAAEQKLADSGRDAVLHEAVAKFIKAKGRFHTEQNYAALVAAYDAVQQGEQK